MDHESDAKSEKNIVDLYDARVFVSVIKKIIYLLGVFYANLPHTDAYNT